MFIIKDSVDRPRICLQPLWECATRWSHYSQPFSSLFANFLCFAYFSFFAYGHKNGQNWEFLHTYLDRIGTKFSKGGVVVALLGKLLKLSCFFREHHRKLWPKKSDPQTFPAIRQEKWESLHQRVTEKVSCQSVEKKGIGWNYFETFLEPKVSVFEALKLA